MNGVAGTIASALGRLWLLGALLALYAARVFWISVIKDGEGELIGPISGALLGAIGVVIALNLARDWVGREAGSDDPAGIGEAAIGIAFVVSAGAMFFAAVAGWIGGLVVSCAMSALLFWICREGFGRGIWIRVGVAAMPLAACGAAVWAMNVFGAG